MWDFVPLFTFWDYVLWYFLLWDYGQKMQYYLSNLKQLSPIYCRQHEVTQTIWINNESLTEVRIQRKANEKLPGCRRTNTKCVKTQVSWAIKNRALYYRPPVRTKNHKLLIALDNSILMWNRRSTGNIVIRKFCQKNLTKEMLSSVV